jgi:hypothetical protein
MGMHPEVHLRRVEREWECTQAAPEVWFGQPFLSAVPGRIETVPWHRAGDYIKLTASNGSWIWKLTGETATGLNIDGPFEICRAVWPD